MSKKGIHVSSKVQLFYPIPLLQIAFNRTLSLRLELLAIPRQLSQIHINGNKTRSRSCIIIMPRAATRMVTAHNLH